MTNILTNCSLFVVYKAFPPENNPYKNIFRNFFVLLFLIIVLEFIGNQLKTIIKTTFSCLPITIYARWAKICTSMKKLKSNIPSYSIYIYFHLKQYYAYRSLHSFIITVPTYLDTLALHLRSCLRLLCFRTNALPHLSHLCGIMPE